MSLTGNKDTDRLIIKELDTRSFMNLYKTNNKYIRSLYDENMFRARVEKEFPRLLHLKGNKTWKQFYVYLVYWASFLKEKYGFVSNDFRIDPIEYFSIISRELRKLDPKFEGIREIEHLYGVKFGSKEYRDRIFNKLMERASRLGLIDLIEFAIKEGARNYQGGLNEASYAGNLEAFHFFYPKYADNLVEALDYTWDGNNPKMFEYINSLLEK